MNKLLSNKELPVRRFYISFPLPAMIRATLTLLLRTACLGTAALCLTGTASAQLAKKTTDPGNDPAFIKKAASEIDRRLANDFKKKNVAALPAVDDSRWMRRLYLDATGRIPTYEEAITFLNDTAPDKREKLVDTLLKSEGYTGSMYNYYLDLLRATSRLGTDGTRSGV